MENLVGVYIHDNDNPSWAPVSDPISRHLLVHIAPESLRGVGAQSDPARTPATKDHLTDSPTPSS
jgi:hypothetical protein